MAKITVNPVQKFRSLVPGPSRTYATVAAVNSGANTSLVTLQNGDQLIVKGSAYAVSDRVMVVDSEIRQKVSDLPMTTVTIF